MYAVKIKKCINRTFLPACGGVAAVKAIVSASDHPGTKKPRLAVAHKEVKLHEIVTISLPLRSKEPIFYPNYQILQPLTASI